MANAAKQLLLCAESLFCAGFVSSAPVKCDETNERLQINFPFNYLCVSSSFLTSFMRN